MARSLRLAIPLASLVLATSSCGSVASDSVASGKSGTGGNGLGLGGAGSGTGPSGCPMDPGLMQAGSECEGPDRTCGECPDDPCAWCNLTRCEAGAWVLVSAAPPPGCGTGGAGGFVEEPAVGQHVWTDSSRTALWVFSTGATMPGFESSSRTCRVLSRGTLSTAQLQQLDALVLVESDGLCLEDGWEEHQLSVFDEDGTSRTYSTNGCNVEFMLPSQPMSDFPLGNAPECPEG